MLLIAKFALLETSSGTAKIKGLCLWFLNSYLSYMRPRLITTFYSALLTAKFILLEKGFASWGFKFELILHAA